MEILSLSAEQTQDLAKRIASRLVPGDVLALYGDLGAGKTTFTNFLVQGLNINARVQSPTFVIARCYQGNGMNGICKVHHADLYRLANEGELADLGIHELFGESDSILVVEWPEFLEQQLPANTIKIRFTLLEDGNRKIYVENTNRFN